MSMYNKSNYNHCYREDFKMYVFNEKFNLTNDTNMPYSLTEENLYPYTNTSGWVEDGKFVFAREGARFIL